jgi:hypothetical protein
MAKPRKAKPFQSLKSIPSNEELPYRNPPVERIFPESTPKRASTEGTPNQSGLVSKALFSFELREATENASKFKRRQETSSTMVKVEFPKTVNLGAHAELYESKSKAIAALYEYKLSELSNFCTYDPSTHTIFAHTLESSVPNPAVLKQAGLEVLWLPMQKKIAKLIQEKEKAQYKTSELSLIEEKQLAITQNSMIPDISGCSFNPDMISAHHHGMLAANLYNLDHRGSQFEGEAEFIDPNPSSPSSSLQIDPASPQREDDASIFDDDFFLEVDPDMARSFLGSQYSEASRSSSPNGNRLSGADLFGTGLAKELLWSLDENEEVKPMRTWVDLGREYLAQHPPRGVRGSEEDSEPTDNNSEYSTASDPISFTKSSGIGPSIEHIEDIVIFEKCHPLKGIISGKPGFSSIFADEGNVKLPKRKHCRSWSMSSRYAPKQSILPREKMLDIATIEVRVPDLPKVDPIATLKLPDDLRSGCEISEIPFPAKEIPDTFSRRSSLSYTSYIEAERARERMYQNSPLVTASREYVETEDIEAVPEICLEPKQSTESEKCPPKLVDSELRVLDNTGTQPESENDQDIMKKTSTGSDDSDEFTDCRRSSCIPLASGPEFREYGKQTAYRSNLETTKTGSEDFDELADFWRGSDISFASGFRFTDYSKQIAIEEEREVERKISNYSVSANSATAMDPPRLLDILQASIPISNDDLTGDNEENTQLEYRKMVEELGYEKIRDSDLSQFPKDSNRAHNLSWKAIMDDANIRVVGKAARQNSQVKDESKKVGALVDLFQAHGLMQSMKPALHQKQSPSPLLHQPSGRPATSTARIVTPSGAVYHPSGTVCVTAGRPLSSSPIKRVPTPCSPIVRPSSGLSSVDTDFSELFREQLKKAEKHSEVDYETEANEEI